MALVVKSWSVNETPLSPADPLVQIHGRKEGIFAFLLSLVGIDPTQSLEVLGDSIVFREGSLAGQMTVHTPADRIATTFSGYAKPWREAIIIGGFLAVLTFFLAGLPGILLGVLYYFLNKTLTVGFTTVGGDRFAVDFKRSVIEGKNIDEAAAARVAEIVRGVVAVQR